MERLTKTAYVRMEGAQYAQNPHCKMKPLEWQQACVNELGRLETLNENGRLHIAPCENGTVIYFRDEEEAQRILESIDGECNDYYIHGYTEAIYGEFGVDWFLTPEEARIATKED